MGTRPITNMLIRHPLLLSLLVVVSLFCLNLLFLHPFWESNDDPFIAMICSGNGFSLRPDEHLSYTNVLLGLVLKFLYRRFPAFPWYTYNLLLMQLISYWAICYAFVSKRASALQIILFVVFFAAFGLHFSNSLQFTTTAFLLALAACSLLLVWLDYGYEKKNVWVFVVSLVLFLLSGILRIQSLLLGLLLFLGTIVAGFVSAKDTIRRLFLAFFLAIVCAASFGLQWVNSRYYAKDDWKPYYRVEKARREFTDYPDRSFSGDKLSQALQEVNWTENDVALIRLFFTLDENVYTVENIEKVSRSLGWQRVTFRDYRRIFAEILSDILVWPALLLVPVFSLFSNRRRFGARSQLVFLVEFALLMIALSTRNPPRVYVPIFSFLTAIALLNVDERKLIERFRSMRRGGTPARLQAAAVAVLSVVAFGFFVQKTCLAPYQEKARGRAILKQAIRELNPKVDSLYLAWASAFHYEVLDPLEDLRPYFTSFRLVPITWIAQAPIVTRRLKDYGIGGKDFCTDLYTNKNVFLMSDNDWKDLLGRHLWEHYHQKVSYTQVYGLHDGFWIYQMHANPDGRQP